MKDTQPQAMVFMPHPNEPALSNGHDKCLVDWIDAANREQLRVLVLSRRVGLFNKP